MRLYTHLTPFEREKLMFTPAEKESPRLHAVLDVINRRSPESSNKILFHWTTLLLSHRALTPLAERHVIPKRKLDDEEIRKQVRELFYFKQWSPQQIAARLKEEK